MFQAAILESRVLPSLDVVGPPPTRERGGGEIDSEQQKKKNKLVSTPLPSPSGATSHYVDTCTRTLVPSSESARSGGAARSPPKAI